VSASKPEAVAVHDTSGRRAPASDGGDRSSTSGLRERAIVFVALAVLLSVSAPVIWHGAPLADEYHLCMRPQLEGGYGPYLSHIWGDTGVVRPARLVELFLVSELCHAVPFGAIIIVPLLIKIAVAWLLLGLLRDLRLPSPWPAVGAALWLLEPLGTEAALWPAALHVNLGLGFVIGGLRLHSRGHAVAGALATLAGCLSVEQAIFALPLATWLVTPPAHRRGATLASVLVAVAVIGAYATWPGVNPRQDVPLAERLALMIKPAWYVVFPVVGLGLHSGLMGFIWALPWSLPFVIGSAWAGWRYGPRLFGRDGASGWSGPLQSWWFPAASAAALLLLVNLPLIVTEVGYSPRTFTPTWLVLAGLLATGGSCLPAQRYRLAGLAAGTFAAFAVLSLALSAWVRVETVAFNRAALGWIAEQTEDGAVVAICNVERTVVEPAPSGAFHLHAFHSENGNALLFHTGRRGQFRRSGERYWGSPCPDLEGADLVVDFRQLTALAAERRR
jgi:hypothetical protein